MTSDSSEHAKQGKEVPTLKKSNALIKKDAPKALHNLELFGALDLVDALGLRPYFKG